MIPENVLVVSGHSNPGRFEVANWQRIADWADQLGFDHQIYTTPETFYCERRQAGEKDDAFFARYPAILAGLDTHDWVLWLDSDVIPMRVQAPQVRADKDVYVAGNFCLVNTGVMLVRSCDLVRELFAEVLAMRYRTEDDYMWHWLINAQYRNRDETYVNRLYERNYRGVLARTEFLDPVVWNANLQTAYWHCPQLDYLDHDPDRTVLLHLAGMSGEEREQYLHLGL